MTHSRRDFVRLAAAAPLSAALLGQIDSTIGGVMVGAQTYSFRDRPLDGCIAAMKEIGLGYAELWQGHLEPKGKDELKEFRARPPLDRMKDARRKFDEAGIRLYALNYSFREDFSDAEIENGFKIAQAMGLDKITASSNVSTARRIYPLAARYRIYVGMHNHDSMRKNEFSTPEDFAEAMAGREKWIKINLDIGHFTAANFDPVAFIERRHADILTMHIKDRKRNHGPNMPFGEGDTKIREALRTLKTNRYPIPAMIEYEYGGAGGDAIAEVRKSFDYVKRALQ